MLYSALIFVIAALALTVLLANACLADNLFDASSRSQAAKSALSNMAQFTAPGISFKYPRDWKQTHGASGRTTFTAKEWSLLTTSVVEVKGNIKLEPFADGVQQGAEDPADNGGVKFTLVSRKSLKLNGIPAIKLVNQGELSTKIGKVKLQQTMIVAIYKDRAYSLLFFAIKDWYKEFGPAFQAIEDSVKFN